MDNPPVEVPRVLRLMWGMPQPARRGPKPAHTLEDIAEVAVRLADAHGLTAASLPRVAAALGVGTTSLYRYIETRDDLDTAMLDNAYGPPPSLSRQGGWRASLRSWARANLATLHAHPWLLAIPTPDPPLGPNRTAWTERGLSAFDGMDLGFDDQLTALLLVEILVRGEAQLTRASTTPLTPDDARPMSYPALLAAVISEDKYPRLTGALKAGALSRDDDPLTVSLGVLLEGLAARWDA
jgi:AcrR family transcriptional regulator